MVRYEPDELPVVGVGVRGSSADEAAPSLMVAIIGGEPHWEYHSMTHRTEIAISFLSSR